MNYKQFTGLIIATVAIVMLVSPVAACDPIVTTYCPASPCLNCPTTCDITVTWYPEDRAYSGIVDDTLPAGATAVSYNPAPTVIGPGNVIWAVGVPAHATTPDVFHVTFTPPAGSFTNTAEAYATVGSAQGYDYDVSDVITPIPCANAPEFPSMFLPLTFVIGFLGAVLLIQRNRDQ